jgi:translation initiation factor IF-3
VIRKRFIKRPTRQLAFKANHQIRFPEVRVLSEHGEMVGIMPTSEALRQAQDQNKDLVLVTEKAKPPIVKIIELAKYKYQLQQRESENRKKSRVQDIKELQFSPFIGEGDLQVRLRRIDEFLTRGDKVRLIVDFKKGRQMSKQEFGHDLLKRIFEVTGDAAVVEIQPQLIGKKLMAQLMPNKKAKSKVKDTNEKNQTENP